MFLYKHVTANNILLKENNFQRELPMEAYLIENVSILSLSEDNEDFQNPEIIESELTVKMGRKSKDTDGRIDLIASYNQDDYLGIIELKLGTLNKKHLLQLQDYLKQKEFIEGNLKERKLIQQDSSPKFIGILVGSNVEIELVQDIANGTCFENNIPIYAIVLKRYKGSDGNVYVISDVYGPKTTSSRDYSKYEFNGNVYRKGRLVLAVVRQYISDNPEVTVEQLKRIFPKDLQGNKGVLDDLEYINENYDDALTRFFAKEDEVIELKNKSKIAVCSQWGSNNIGKFIEHANYLKYKIKKIDE